jgi:3-hydroxybutyryl-CoA dehydratase
MNLVVDQKFTANFVVTPTVHSGFISTFLDRHALHTDQTYAQSLGFQGVVMHGNILNGFISYLVGEILPLPDVMILRQEIKFSHPVYLNDQIALEAIVKEVHESVQVATLGFRFTNAAGNSVARGSVEICNLNDRRKREK